MRSCDGSFFFFNDTATTEIYPYCHTLSLPRALPILEAHGYSSAPRSQYVRAGWLESPARRVYRRSRAPLTWPQVVISLQTVLDLPLTVGGRTALEQLGYAHYLSAEMRAVHLYGPKRPPTWLDSLTIDVDRKSTRLNASNSCASRMPSSA